MSQALCSVLRKWLVAQRRSAQWRKWFLSVLLPTHTMDTQLALPLDCTPWPRFSSSDGARDTVSSVGVGVCVCCHGTVCSCRHPLWQNVVWWDLRMWLPICGRVFVVIIWSISYFLRFDKTMIWIGKNPTHFQDSIHRFRKIVLD